MVGLFEQMKSIVGGSLIEIAVDIGVFGNHACLGLGLFGSGGRNRRGCDQRKEKKLDEPTHVVCKIFLWELLNRKEAIVCW
jgi:hypothetical protein